MSAVSREYVAIVTNPHTSEEERFLVEGFGTSDKLARRNALERIKRAFPKDFKIDIKHYHRDRNQF